MEKKKPHYLFRFLRFHEASEEIPEMAIHKEQTIGEVSRERHIIGYLRQLLFLLGFRIRHRHRRSPLTTTSLPALAFLQRDLLKSLLLSPSCPAALKLGPKDQGGEEEEEADNERKKLHSRRVPQKSKRTAAHVHSTREVQLQPKKNKREVSKVQLIRRHFVSDSS
jgi:hypothetical protein